MARVDLFTATDFLDVEVFYGTVTQATTTRIVIEAGSFVATYIGTGFKYAGDGVVGGMLTGYTLTEAGKLSTKVSGLSVAAQTAFEIIDDEDPQALYRLALRGNDEINGSKGSDHLLGYAGKDKIAGNDGNDNLAGGNGRDQLFGNAGRDTLDGGEKNDHLFGGKGLDVLSGGNGADRFVFLNLLEARGDTITDFSRAQGDRIDISAIDARKDQSGDQKFKYIGDAEFSGRGQLRYDDGALSGDINGDGKADFTIVLGLNKLFAGDIIL